MRLPTRTERIDKLRRLSDELSKFVVYGAQTEAIRELRLEEVMSLDYAIALLEDEKDWYMENCHDKDEPEPQTIFFAKRVVPLPIQTITAKI